MNLKIFYTIFLSFITISCSIKKLSNNSSNSLPILRIGGKIDKIECYNYDYLCHIDYDFFYTKYLLISCVKKCTIDDNIFKFKNLETLEIFGKAEYKKFDDKRFDYLARLSLIGQVFEKELPPWMYECSAINHLSFEADGRTFDLQTLSRFKSISSLDVIIHNSIDTDVNRFLMDIPNIDTLSIDTERPVNFPNNINYLKKLKWLSINTDISGKIDSLALLEHLEILEVGSFKNFEEEYQNLIKLKSLKFLRFKERLSETQYYKLKNFIPHLDLGR